MTFMSNGKLSQIELTKDDVVKLINNQVKQMINIAVIRHKITQEEKNKIFGNFVKSIGYEIKEPTLLKDVTSEDITPILKTELNSKDVIKIVSTISGVDEGGMLCHGIRGRLKEVVNKRYKEEGKRPLVNIDDALIKPQDVDNLIELLSYEVKEVYPDRQINRNEQKYISTIIQEGANSIKEGKEVKNEFLDQFSGIATNSFYNKAQEFFAALLAIFKNEVKIYNMYTHKLKEREEIKSSEIKSLSGPTSAQKSQASFVERELARRDEVRSLSV